MIGTICGWFFLILVVLLFLDYIGLFKPRND